MNRKIIFAAVFLIIGFFVGFMANSRTTVIYEEIDSLGHISFSYDKPVRTASIMVPAVDENKKGLTTILKVEIIPGKGRVLANIGKMLYEPDSQNSVRIAHKVASEKTGTDLSNYDVIYTVETDATAIEGPSAGAASAVAAIAALTGRKIKEGVLITGAINHDGTIGPVSNVMEKAHAVSDMGINTLLVPLTQGSMDRFETRRCCEEIGTSSICMDEEIPQKSSLSDLAGIEVIEVIDIDEALGYLIE
ncbi:MAG TPA: hypothetical protein ENN61_03300 [Bacteroidaceae bacterium]|nr:hypothetical protein [Bacteroidaceae bacterium]